jgi:aryl-alcohol dehydrogenase-like predicted oxidoreductase
LDWCAKNKCGVIPYSPMQCGLLTGKVTPEWVAGLPEDDWRKTKLEFLAPSRLPQLIELVDELKEIATSTGHTAAQLAVAWVLRRKEVTAAIVGARKLGQISEIVPAAGWVLSGEELEQIEAAYGRYVQAKQYGPA